MTRRIDGLRVIALFKFGKVLLLLAAIYGAYKILNPELAATLQRWSETVTDRFERGLLLKLVDWLDGLNRKSVDGVLLVSGGYAALALVEGIGLWMRKRWGEWMAVVSTSILIPFEAWKLYVAHGGHRELIALVLIANILIVIYLYRELRHRHGR